MLIFMHESARNILVTQWMTYVNITVDIGNNLGRETKQLPFF